MHFAIVSGKVIALGILCWLIYSMMVIIYLNILTRKYLTPIPKDSFIGSKKLKTREELVEQYKDQKAINILVLSGGGIRGMVPLHILSYIEEKTNKKVGELFDFTAGSSTGAVSAAVFATRDKSGGYKYSAKDLLRDYEENSKKMFSAPLYHKILTCFGLFAPKVLPEKKIEILKKYFDSETLADLKGNILVPVYNIDQNRLEIIKNWSDSKEEGSNNYLVTDLIHGASNPPLFFPPSAFSVKGKNSLLIDPAVLLNNPILYILLFVTFLFPDKHLNIFVIGNGGSTASKYDYRGMFSFGLYGLYQYLYSAPGLSSRLYLDFVEEYIKLLATNNTRNISYFRINSIPDVDLSPTDVTPANIENIRLFADKMLRENMKAVNDMIAEILKMN